MSSVTPPPPPTAPPPIPAPTPGPTLTVLDPSTQLTQLRPGALLQAVISARLGQGLFQLQTAQGTLTVQTGLPLPQDGILDLLLQATAPKVQFQISAIDGKPPQASLKTPGGAPLPGAAPGAGAGAVAAAGAGTAPGPPLAAGAALTATLLRPAPGAAPLPSQAAPPGAALGNGAGPRIPAVTTPPSQPPAAVGAAPKSVPAAGAGAVPKSGTALPAGTQFAVKVLAVAQAAATVRPAGGTVIGTGQVLTGTVTGKTAAGQPILHTRAGVMALIVRAPLPEGSRVTLEVTASPVPPKPPGGIPLRESLCAMGFCSPGAGPN